MYCMTSFMSTMKSVSGMKTQSRTALSSTSMWGCAMAARRSGPRPHYAS
jgi:hypothetical protein